MLKQLFNKSASILTAVALVIGTLTPTQVYAANNAASVMFEAGAGAYFVSTDGKQIYTKIVVSDSNNDGKINPEYPFVIGGQTYTAQKAGYSLTSFQNASGITLTPGNSWEIELSNTAQIFTAQYEGKKYSVKFTDDRGNASAQTKEVQAGDNNDLSWNNIFGSSEPSEFIGWIYTTSEGTQVFFHKSGLHIFEDQSGNDIFSSSAPELKAAYAGTQTLTVNYVANGGSGSMAASTFQYGTENTLTANTFVKSDSVFKGWNTKADGTGITYADKQQTYINFGLTDSTLTLYAQWKDTSNTGGLTVRFIENNTIIDGVTTGYQNHFDEILSSTAKQFYSTAVAKLPEQLPSQAGYYVTDWQVVKVKDGTITPADKTVPSNSYFKFTNGLLDFGDGTTATSYQNWVSEDGILYLMPVWKPIKVKLAYHANGGGGQTPSDVVLMCGQEYTLSDGGTLTHPTKSLMGWSLKANANADNMYTGQNSPSDSLVYPVDYTLRTIKSSTQTYKLLSDPFTKYLDVTKWTTDITINPTRFDYNTGTLDLTDMTNNQIYAIWDSNTYTVKFDRNDESIAGGSGVMQPQEIRCGAQMPLSENTFSLSGYVFEGWNTKADGTGESYADRAVVKDLATRNKEITLYAQWSKGDIAKVSLQVTQSWQDNSNQDGIRPSSLEYNVIATVNGQALTASDLGLSTLSFTVDAGQSLQTLAEIPAKYLQNGQYYNISYRVVVGSLPSSYISSLSYSASSSEVKAAYTFKHTPETKNYPVTVKFSDNSNQDGLRPGQVKITIKGSDGSSTSSTVNVTGDTSTFMFEDLPVYANGTKITYTVSAADISGYTVLTKSSTSSASVTASHTPATTSVKVSAKWEDHDNQDKTRPRSISVTLTASDGRSYKATLAGESWTASITNIGKYYQGSETTGALTVTPVTGYSAEITGTMSGGFNITLKLSDLAKKKVEASKQTDKIKKTDTQQAVVTPPEVKETHTIGVRTIWNDSEQEFLRPLTIRVTLVGSDKSKTTKVLTSATGFTATFTDMPVKDEKTGKPVEYQISYAPISGYTTHVYHNRQNPDEFILEQFYPGNAATFNEDVVSTSNNLISIGATQEESTAYTDEEGNEISLTHDPDACDTPEIFKGDTRTNWRKLIVPGTIGLGLLGVAIAILLLLKSNRR